GVPSSAERLIVRRLPRIVISLVIAGRPFLQPSASTLSQEVRTTSDRRSMTSPPPRSFPAGQPPKARFVFAATMASPRVQTTPSTTIVAAAAWALPRKARTAHVSAPSLTAFVQFIGWPPSDVPAVLRDESRTQLWS